MSLTDPHLPIEGDAVLPGQHEVEPLTRSGLKQGAAEQTGRSFTLGATVLAGGVNFSVFSRQASRMELLLFDDPAAVHAARVIELDPRTHRTYQPPLWLHVMFNAYWETLDCELPLAPAAAGDGRSITELQPTTA